jgi:hypothetical protein
MSSSPNGYPSKFPPESALSPYKHARDRPASRSSSRTSFRTHSPSFSIDDPGECMSRYNLFRMVLTKLLLLVAVRNQVSTLKHNIRHQQAQLNTLENIVRSGPRPYWPEIISDNHNDMQATASSSSTPPSSYVPGTSTPTKVKRRSSHDVLLNIAGPESHLPLPKREAGEENGIREGIPSNYPPSQTSFKRTPSPTRTLSRASSLYLYKVTKNSCTRFLSRDTRVISR